MSGDRKAGARRAEAEAGAFQEEVALLVEVVLLVGGSAAVLRADARVRAKR
jgi:hypothetical protein